MLLPHAQCRHGGQGSETLLSSQQAWGPQECQWLSIAGGPSESRSPRPRGGVREFEACIVCRSSYKILRCPYRNSYHLLLRILNVNNHQEAQKWTQRSMFITVPSPIRWKPRFFLLPSLICPNSIYCPSTDRCTDYSIMFSVASKCSYKSPQIFYGTKKDIK